MIVYEKGGKHFILMANSSRGVMKLQADNLESYKPITAQTEVTGVPYETIAKLEGRAAPEESQRYDGADSARRRLFDGPSHHCSALTACFGARSRLCCFCLWRQRRVSRFR